MTLIADPRANLPAFASMSCTHRPSVLLLFKPGFRNQRFNKGILRGAIDLAPILKDSLPTSARSQRRTGLA